MTQSMRPVGGTGIGAPVKRLEDERLLTGRGRYADDLLPRDVVFASVLRSPHAHAVIRGIDVSDALTAPDVLLILTGEDILREKVGGLPCVWTPPMTVGKPFVPEQPLLAIGKVRHVGDPVAFIVAKTMNAARDASERILVDYDPLPAVTLGDANEAKASKVWDEAQGNVSFALEAGDSRLVDEQFSAAKYVAKVAVHYPRANGSPIEPRSSIAFYEASNGRFSLVSTTQDPFQVRHFISRSLRIPAHAIKVQANDIGGSFGLKGQVYPEEVLVVWAASKLNLSVKWTGDRSENFAADMHGRHQIADAEMAFDADGHVLALRTNVLADIGAYPASASGVAPLQGILNYPGPYRIPLIHSKVRAIFTNTSQLGPYRGTGKPEATIVLERLMEKAAAEIGIDSIELRRRNLIHASEMPYRTPGGLVYDCGDFEGVLDKALALAKWQEFEGRKADSERRGLLRGIGLCFHCQRAGQASERMEVRIGENGAVAIYAGTFATGQGHETMFAQMVSSWLGVPIDEVRLFHGDTDQVLFGRGSFAQRSMSTGGAALKVAVDEVIRKARRIAAWAMKVTEDDVVFGNAHFLVKGTNRGLSFHEVAERSYIPEGLPAEFGVGLDAVGSDPGPCTFPNGCMIAEVEIDPETGVTRLDRIYSVDDSGNAINPLTLDGQLHGSIAQGVGEGLLESVLYEPGTAQLLTGSFMDYAMPRADFMPDIVSQWAPVPTKLNPMGAKGGSEAGNTAGPAAIINAVLNALSPYGITDIAVPAVPHKVWRAIRDAEALSRNSA
jgi:aerobic carbon-monoxide dehydrogenase large subunit